MGKPASLCHISAAGDTPPPPANDPTAAGVSLRAQGCSLGRGQYQKAPAEPIPSHREPRKGIMGAG